MNKNANLKLRYPRKVLCRYFPCLISETGTKAAGFDLTSYKFAADGPSIVCSPIRLYGQRFFDLYHQAGMSNIKEAIVRLSRSVRQWESLKLNASALPLAKGLDLRGKHRNTSAPQESLSLPDANISPENLAKFAPLVLRYQKQVFRNFLEPLNVPDLKAFSDEPPYQSGRALSNWKVKRREDRVGIFENFLNDRIVFNKMLDFLVEVTPAELKSAENIQNGRALEQVLLRQLTRENEHLFREKTPFFHFAEVPPIPKNLTPETFQEYIYFLTHLRCLYRNLSSLHSGIILEILLYTHKLTNTDFKPYRSVHTYNYLIKFFGYAKHQSSFARELLLVMTNDGHTPNIDTINNLLMLCQIHSDIRLVQNTYQIIIKYLRLIKMFKLEANLTTWNRIYDCINNIFLKEVFINRMVDINLPILRNASLRILDDFLMTTTNRGEAEVFIEEDLGIKNWRNEPKIFGKVIRHEVKRARSQEELESVWKILKDNWDSVDEFVLQSFLEGIFANDKLQYKPHLVLKSYVELFEKCGPDMTKVLKVMISVICKNEENFDVRNMGELVRFLIYEATKLLYLPEVYIRYEKGAAEKPPFLEKALSHQDAQVFTEDMQEKPGVGEQIDYESDSAPESPVKVFSGADFSQISRRFEYTFSPKNVSENYRILQRLVGFHLTRLEGLVIYCNEKKGIKGYKNLYDPLTKAEEHKWASIKEHLRSAKSLVPDSDTIQLLGLTSADIELSGQSIDAYVTFQNRRIGNAKTRNRLRRLHKGLDKSTELEMTERKLWVPPA